jgi:hypothetical protein
MKKQHILISAVFIVATAFTLVNPMSNNLPETRKQDCRKLFIKLK